MRRAQNSVSIRCRAAAVLLAFGVGDAAAGALSRGHGTKAAATPPPGGYYVPYATGPAGEKVPVMSIPGSVAVIPRSMMDDQAATSVCGALRNVSGVICR